jgi:predicted nucleotidyltransferase
MASCEYQLTEFLKQIEPTSTQKDGGRRSHNFLRDILDTGNMSNRVVDSYLSGSYARDTAIRPLEDVDIIFVIDPARWPQNGFRLILDDDYPEPETVLKTFMSAIRYRYRDSSLRLQNRSVRLRLFHLDIDVVPAIDKGKNDGSILIPDRRKREWIMTAPKRHNEIASALNKRHDGRFKPLAKLLKFWNAALPSTATFKSFAIETMACRLFQGTALRSLEEGLLLFFDFVSSFGNDGQVYKWSDKFGISLDWLECKVPDAANTGSNVTAGIDETRKQKFIKSAIVSRNRMIEARNSRYDGAAWNRVSQALHC